MQAAGQAVDFAYATGEEVVVRLTGVEVFNVDEGRRVPAACVPAWTIATVAGRSEAGGEARYALRFPHHDATCVCVTDESAIDGVA